MSYKLSNKRKGRDRRELKGGKERGRESKREKGQKERENLVTERRR